LTGKGYVEHIGRRWISAHCGAARHYVRIATSEDDDLTGFQRNWFAVDNARKTATGRHYMIGNQMVRAREDLR
jgi:hypothetical protein